VKAGLPDFMSGVPALLIRSFCGCLLITTCTVTSLSVRSGFERKERFISAKESCTQHFTPWRRRVH
jgi:hypothetical protein